MRVCARVRSRGWVGGCHDVRRDRAHLGPNGAPVLVGPGGTPTFTTGPTRYDQAAHFNGPDYKATLAPQPDITGPYTVDAWIRGTTIANTVFPTVVSKQSGVSPYPT